MDEVETLIEKARSKNLDERREALLELFKMGKPAVGAFAVLLKDENAQVRATAALALGQMKEASGSGPLVEALNDVNENVRDTAVTGLRLIGEPAIGPLVEASRKPEYAHLRRTIAKLLQVIEADVKQKPRDFGCRETGLFRAPKIPDEFRNAMLDKTVKVRV